jgi:hypothetical protein
MIDEEGYFLEYNFITDEQRKLKPGAFNMLISDNDELLYKICPKSTQIVRISDNEEIGRIIAKNGDDYLAAVKNDKYFVTKLLEMYDISGLTTVESKATEQVEITPNPAFDILKISNIPPDVRTIEITDIKGIIKDSFIIKMTMQYLEADISSYSNGAYFVRFITDNSTFSKKIIINK